MSGKSPPLYIHETLGTISMEVIFNNIESRIKELIKNARNELLIVVPWINNKDIFDQILLKCPTVKTTIIVENDEINKSANLNYQSFIDSGGLLYNPQKRLVHDKLCVIDNETVITGSYNWTYGAEYKNHEHIIVSNNSEIASIFKSEIDLILQECKEVTDYNSSIESTFERISNIYSSMEISIGSLDEIGKVILELYHSNKIDEGINLVDAVINEIDFTKNNSSEFNKELKYGILIFKLLSKEELKAKEYHSIFNIKGSLKTLKSAVEAKMKLYTNKDRTNIISKAPKLIMECYNERYYLIGLNLYRSFTGNKVSKYHFNNDLALAGYIILLANNLVNEADELFQNSRLTKDKRKIQMLVKSEIRIQI